VIVCAAQIVPGLAEYIPAIGQVTPVGGEYFKRDCAIIARLLNRLNGFAVVHRTCAERHVEVGVSAFVVVNVNMAQALSVRGQDFAGRVVWHDQIGVSDIEMQA
jgi:hypothetical protein